MICMIWWVNIYQTTFIGGRRIGDNIIAVQNIFRNYHRNSGTPQLGICYFFVFDSFEFSPRFMRWNEECDNPNPIESGKKVKNER